MKSKKILLVDDEIDILTTFQSILESEGFNVITATDGVETLSKIRLELPDIIVLDVMLPRLDGYKVCRILKFDEQFQNIPIIMMTARAMEKDRDMGLLVGADLYITKPFEPDTLVAKIKELLISPPKHPQQPPSQPQS